MKKQKNKVSIYAGGYIDKRPNYKPNVVQQGVLINSFNEINGLLRKNTVTIDAILKKPFLIDEELDPSKKIIYPYMLSRIYNYILYYYDQGSSGKENDAVDVIEISVNESSMSKMLRMVQWIIDYFLDDEGYMLGSYEIEHETISDGRVYNFRMADFFLDNFYVFSERDKTYNLSYIFLARFLPLLYKHRREIEVIPKHDNYKFPVYELDSNGDYIKRGKSRVLTDCNYNKFHTNMREFRNRLIEKTDAEINQLDINDNVLADMKKRYFNKRKKS